MILAMMLAIAAEAGFVAAGGSAGGLLGMYFFKKWVSRVDEKLDLIPDIHTRVVRLEKDQEYQAAIIEDVRREQTQVRKKLEARNE